MSHSLNPRQRRHLLPGVFLSLEVNYNRYCKRGDSNCRRYPQWRQHPPPRPGDNAAQLQGYKQNGQKAGKSHTRNIHCGVTHNYSTIKAIIPIIPTTIATHTMVSAAAAIISSWSSRLIILLRRPARDAFHNKHSVRKLIVVDPYLPVSRRLSIDGARITR